MLKHRTPKEYTKISRVSEFLTAKSETCMKLNKDECWSNRNQLKIAAESNGVKFKMLLDTGAGQIGRASCRERV